MLLKSYEELNAEQQFAYKMGWAAARASLLWVVGRWPGDGAWELQGVYSTKEQAEANSQPSWFVAPVVLDSPLPIETTEWPDLEWT